MRSDAQLTEQEMRIPGGTARDAGIWANKFSKMENPAAILVVLDYALNAAREEGRQEERARWISAANGHADHAGAECVALVVRDATGLSTPPQEQTQEERKRWQSIDPDEDAAPRDGTWVLLFGDGAGFASCQFVGYYGSRSGYDEEACWRQTAWRGEPASPTHWMPLPEPPINTQAQEQTRDSEVVISG